ncbi:insulinase family protein [bacterium]|nr:insulinase family protein [bacterium]
MSQFNKTILPNGLRIVSETMDQTHSVALGIWILCGSVDEDIHLTGISHLLEHLVFKGTEHRSGYDIAVSLESLGGSLNAVTDREYTCYYTHSLSRHIDDALEVLSDLTQKARISKKDIEIEKAVVAEEILSLEDSPEDQVVDNLMSSMYPDDAMGRPVLGSEETLATISQDDLFRYREKWYNASHIIISAAGDVDHDVFVQKVEALFGNMKPGDSNGHMRTKSGVPTDIIHNKDISQSHVALGVAGPSYTDNEKYSIILGNTYLGGGMASLLFQQLREESGLVYTIYSWNDFYHDTSQTGIYFGTSPKNRSKAVSMVKNITNDFVDISMTEEDLLRIKDQIVFGFQLASEDSHIRMQRLAKMEIHYGKFFEDNTIINRFKSITTQNIQDVLRQYLNSNRWFSAIIEP